MRSKRTLALTLLICALAAALAAAPRPRQRSRRRTDDRRQHRTGTRRTRTGRRLHLHAVRGILQHRRYTIADAVHDYKTDLPTIGNYGGVQLTGGSFGSSVYPVPGHSNEVFGLEDRGPNVESADGFAVEPKPDHDPSIARFLLAEGEAELVERIPLRDSTGHPFSGLVNSNNPTGEKVENLKGHELTHDPDDLVVVVEGIARVQLDRQAGRRRIPRNQHVGATGGDEHHDGHDPRERSALSPG
jgi:hypothetical protein